MRAIHQFVAGFAGGDAISNEALALRRLFRRWGYESDIFTEARRCLPEHRRTVRDLADSRSACTPGAIAVLHFSIGSPVNTVFSELPCSKALIYHNITPARYFHLINRQAATTLEQGRRQLVSLANCAAVNMAVSRFNASELTDAGYPNVQVVPLMIDFDRLAIAPSRSTLRHYNDDTATLLFVGRCVPNKKIEDIIELFDLFQRHVEPRSRFVHAGSSAGGERYYRLLKGMALERGLKNVHFTGPVSQSELNALYHCADAFVCMSEHEGFCIPVMESFYHQTPVMAFAAGAVPETLGDAGVLFHEKHFPALAEMTGALIRDEPFRQAIIEGQQQRLKAYRSQNPETILRQCLGPLLEEKAAP